MILQVFVLIQHGSILQQKDYEISQMLRFVRLLVFPLGANTPFVKAFEAKDAIKNGADEVDMVINIGALKSQNLVLVEEDIAAVVEASGDTLVKVIIETCLLTDEEKL